MTNVEDVERATLQAVISWLRERAQQRVIVRSLAASLAARALIEAADELEETTALIDAVRRKEGATE